MRIQNAQVHFADEGKRRLLLPALYLVVVLPVIFFLAFLRQPIGVADEWAHLARAAQIADGIILTEVAKTGLPPQASMDPSFHSLVLMVHDNRTQPLGSLLPKLRTMVWTSERILVDNNAGVYFPAPYLASALVIALSRETGGSLVETLNLVSLVNGVLCAALAAVAMIIAPWGRFIFFVVASLPMTLFQFASGSPDGFLIICAMMIAALIARAWHMGELGISPLLLSGLFGIVLSATKLPYLPASVAALVTMWFGVQKRPDWRWLVITLLLLVLVPIAWLKVSNAGAVDMSFGQKVGDAGKQIELLLGRPLAVFEIATSTLYGNGLRYLHEMVGFLGWLDAPIRGWSVVVLIGILLLLGSIDGAGRASLKLRLLVLAGVLASFGAVFFAVYVSINKPGDLSGISGVQGRYFLPLLPLLALTLPSPRRNYWAICLPVAVFAALLSSYETLSTVVVRYYM